LPKQAAYDQQGNSDAAREAHGLVKGRIAVALILALPMESVLPGIALAWRAGPSPGQTLLICTGDGIS
jgi:hypothetical protein